MRRDREGTRRTSGGEKGQEKRTRGRGGGWSRRTAGVLSAGFDGGRDG